MLRLVAVIVIVVLAKSAFAVAPLDTSSELIISVRDQKLMLLRNGSKVATYPISTSMFGLGDARGRMTTPLGYLAVEKKIGDNVPVGAVFHKRRLTGEVLQPNTPGRDPITTRIIWLRGLEAQNAHAFQRCIYIHGTPEEKKIGMPASYGCIRMKSKDVAELYDQVPVGALVQIIPDRLPKAEKSKPRQEMSGGVVAANITQEPPPQKTIAMAANVAPQPLPISATTVANEAPRRPSKIAAKISATTTAKVTPKPPPQISADMLATPPSSSLSVEEMRTAGALAGARQKAKLAQNKRL
jgi:hypothetical protein